MFIDVVIQTEQAPLKFSKDMTRHEINDVYMKVPENSIRLKEVKDLFYPNKDTKGKSPRAILALGRPGIGKTVLTRKIMHDWAKGIDGLYHGKFAFFFKLRWFHFEQLQNVTLKKFLLFGTELNEEEFESVFAKIWAKPQMAIFIFDGMDEFGGNLEKFRDFVMQSKISSNDCACSMPAMFFFIKIMSGQILAESTVLVTSRPTANDVLSKLHFDRKVEIIGFTEDKIENYVEKFCANYEKNELKTKIWSHIKTSELKNLCYIPVNCFIVCVTLINWIGDQGNDNALPSTLTELYLAALVYFHKNHDRNETKENYEKVIKDLQQLAFNGMESDQLIFDDEFVNEQMKESGLLHCLPVPFFQIQTQVCFIHLSIQEFLAAKHIVETKEPEDVKEFISSHVEHGKWHLVLQFLAGLLGKKMKMFEKYRSCVLAFGQYFTFSTIQGENIEYELQFREVMLMKCIREAENKDIAKEIVNISAFKVVTKIHNQSCYPDMLSASDWAAIIFVCKHLKTLTHLTLWHITNLDCLLEIAKFFRDRCIEYLELHLDKISNPIQIGLEHLFGAITTSQCCISHEHSKLAYLKLYGGNITDAGVSTLVDFFKNSQRLCLKELHLEEIEITSVGISILCKVLGSLTQTCILPYPSLAVWDKKCGLTDLSLSGNDIGDEGVEMLFDALSVSVTPWSLTKLDLSNCSLTKKCMASLCEALGDERFRLTYLNLKSNDIGDEGVDILCCALVKEQCKLTVLNLAYCSLTDGCTYSVFKALTNISCRLTELWLNNPINEDERFLNKFSDEGSTFLRSIEELELCRGRGVRIGLEDNEYFLRPRYRTTELQNYGEFYGANSGLNSPFPLGFHVKTENDWPWRAQHWGWIL